MTGARQIFLAAAHRRVMLLTKEVAVEDPLGVHARRAMLLAAGDDVGHVDGPVTSQRVQQVTIGSGPAGACAQTALARARDATTNAVGARAHHDVSWRNAITG